MEEILNNILNRIESNEKENSLFLVMEKFSVSDDNPFIGAEDKKKIKIFCGLAKEIDSLFSHEPIEESEFWRGLIFETRIILLASFYQFIFEDWSEHFFIEKGPDKIYHLQNILKTKEKIEEYLFQRIKENNLEEKIKMMMESFDLPKKEALSIV